MCGPLSPTPVTVVQVDFSYCNYSFSDNPSHLLLSITTLQIVLSVMLLILAVISTLKQSIVLYKATKKWQPNHYMQQFVKDGILYFLVYVTIFLNSVPFILPASYSQLPTKKLMTLNF
jgi:hypothetical protein